MTDNQWRHIWDVDEDIRPEKIPDDEWAVIESALQQFSDIIGRLGYSAYFDLKDAVMWFWLTGERTETQTLSILRARSGKEHVNVHGPAEDVLRKIYESLENAKAKSLTDTSGKRG